MRRDRIDRRAVLASTPRFRRGVAGFAPKIMVAAGLAASAALRATARACGIAGSFRIGPLAVMLSLLRAEERVGRPPVVIVLAFSVGAGRRAAGFGVQFSDSGLFLVMALGRKAWRKKF